MKVRRDAINSVGLTLLYEPDWPIDPAVEYVHQRGCPIPNPTDLNSSIVLIHGLRGHPVRSWQFKSSPPQTPTTPILTVPYPGIKRRLTKAPPTPQLRRSNSEPLLSKSDRPMSRSRTLGLWKNSTKSSSRLNLDTLLDKQTPTPRSQSLLRKASTKPPPSLKPLSPADETAPPPAADVDTYWPLDFLPASCPNARILTWGYHTLVTRGTPLRQQPTLLDHANDLLVTLAGVRATQGARARPVVFVAHSTGGILVKEVRICFPLSC